jgi:glutamine amidotransferase
VGVPGPAAAATILGETEYGSRFVSAVATDNVLGVQFHPERSGGTGLRFLGGVLRWAA